jgi:hypothetical protein
MEPNLQNTLIQPVPPVTPDKPKSKLFKWIIAAIVFGVLIITISTITYFVKNNRSLNTKSQTASKTQLEATTEQSINIKNVSKDQLPKMAYIYFTGIMGTGNPNPDLGGIFVMNADGTNKRKLASIDKAQLQEVLPNLVYSPTSKELLENTDSGLIGVNIDTGEKRTIFDQKTESYELSNDYKYVCITNSPNQIKIQLDNLAKVPGFDCHQSKQPYYDSVSLKSVDIKPKDTKEGGAGTFTLSSDIAVTNLKNGSKKSFVYDKKEGEFYPYFIANNDIYFTIQPCCALTPFLSGFMQMDLDTGEFSNVTTLPAIYENIQQVTDFNSTFKDNSRSGASVESVSISPNARHFLYNVTYPNGNEYKTTTYDYNTLTNNQTVIKETTESNGRPTDISWSRDDRYVYLANYIYDTTSGKRYDLNLVDPFESYIVLQ